MYESNQSPLHVRRDYLVRFSPRLLCDEWIPESLLKQLRHDGKCVKYEDIQPEMLKMTQINLF